MGYQYVIEIDQDLNLETFNKADAWLDLEGASFQVADIHHIEDSADFPR